MSHFVVCGVELIGSNSHLNIFMFRPEAAENIFMTFRPFWIPIGHQLLMFNLSFWGFANKLIIPWDRLRGDI